MKISETLDRAADHIEQHGWHQGYFWPNDGHELGYPPYVDGDPCCALGAIAVVEEFQKPRHLTMTSAKRRVDEHTAMPWSRQSVVSFGVDFCRRHPMVGAG